MTDSGIDSDHLTPGTIAVVGVPFDLNSSFLRGTAQAPPRIREAMHSYASNLFTEHGIDLGNTTGWYDVGDLDLADEPTAYAEIEPAIAELLARQARIVSLGGDHSITYPIVRAFAREHRDLTILQLDAHPDLYDHLEGNRHSHASPFARIMEEKLASRLVQVGIRTMTDHQREQAKRFEVETIEMKDLDAMLDLEIEGDVYLSFDMDCLDPAFAPGVSHPEPGGLSTRDVLGMIQSLQGRLVGADIVEYNPERDLNGLAAAVCAKLLKEVLGRMLTNAA